MDAEQGAVPSPIVPIPADARLDEDQFDDARLRSGLFGRFAIVDALVTRPGAVYRQIWRADALSLYIGSLFLASAACAAGYGLLMGCFGGPRQALYCAVKVPIVLLGALAVCLPSFYVFGAILGAKRSFRQTALLLLCLTASTAVLLLALGPIAWFFTVSTEATTFLVALHIAAFVIATLFGIHSVHIATTYVARLAQETEQPGRSFVTAWTVVYGAVLCQMVVYLGPLMAPGPFFTGEKRLFLEALFRTW